jgi:regulatory protein
MDGAERGTSTARRKRGRARDDAPAPSTLSFTEQVSLAREAALRLLGVRERSAAELRQRLRQKGFSIEPIDEVISRLQAAGLQSDQRYAELYASNAGQIRGLSARRIQNDLRGKGVGAELASAAAAVRPEDEEERARDIAFRKLRSMAGVAPEVATRRLMGVLARRGYPQGVAIRVISDLVRQSPQRDQDDRDVSFLDPDSDGDVR